MGSISRSDSANPYASLSTAMSELDHYARWEAGGARPERRIDPAVRDKAITWETSWNSAPRANGITVPSIAGGVCKRLFQGEALALVAWRRLRLLAGVSSISVRMARRSSVAEITGKSTTSTHPKASRHCSELKLRSAWLVRVLRHSQ